MLWDTFDPTAAPTFLPRPPVPLAGAPQAAHGLRDAWRSAAASFGSAVRCHAALSGDAYGFGSYLKSLVKGISTAVSHAWLPHPIRLHAALRTRTDVTRAPFWSDLSPSQRAACRRGELGCIFEPILSSSRPLPPCAAAPPAPVSETRRNGSWRHQTLAQSYGGIKRSYPLLELPFWRSCILLGRLLRPNAAVARAVSDEKAKMGLRGAPRPWLALHMRRGDSCRKGRAFGRNCSSGAEYAQRVAQMVALYRYRTVFVATDSDSALGDLRRAIPLVGGWPGATVVTRAAGSRKDGRRQERNIEQLLDRGEVDPWEEFHGFLTDVLLMAECDGMVGKFTSSIDRLVYPLMVQRAGRPVPYYSLDTPWSDEAPMLYDPTSGAFTKACCRGGSPRWGDKQRCFPSKQQAMSWQRRGPTWCP